MPDLQRIFRFPCGPGKVSGGFTLAALGWSPRFEK